MSTINKVVLVTGTNRGIGLSIAKLVAQRSEPITLFATSRKGSSIDGLTFGNPNSTVHYPALDIEDPSAFPALYDLIKREAGKLDIFIANAGVLLEESGASTSLDDTTKTIAINYKGTRGTIDAVVPLLTDVGSVVLVSSIISQQNTFPNSELRVKINSPDLTLDGLDNLVDAYLKASETKPEGDGWLHNGHFPAYASSKAFLNTATAIYARTYPNILFSAVCPGSTQTDMNASARKMGFASKSVGKLMTTSSLQVNSLTNVDDGARLILQRAFEVEDKVSGKFWTAASSTDIGRVKVIDPWQGAPMNFTTL